MTCVMFEVKNVSKSVFQEKVGVKKEIKIHHVSINGTFTEDCVNTDKPFSVKSFIMERF